MPYTNLFHDMALNLPVDVLTLLIPPILILFALLPLSSGSFSPLVVLAPSPLFFLNDAKTLFPCTEDITGDDEPSSLLLLFRE